MGYSPLGYPPVAPPPIPPPPPPPVPLPDPDLPAPVPPPQSPKPIVCPETCDGNECQFPHPLSVHYFYQCINGRAVFTKCPTGKKFDVEANRCIFEAFANTDSRIELTLELGRKMIELEEILDSFETKMNRVQKMIAKSDNRIQLMSKMLLRTIKENRNSLAKCGQIDGEQKLTPESVSDIQEHEIFLDKAIAAAEMDDAQDEKNPSAKNEMEQKVDTLNENKITEEELKLAEEANASKNKNRNTISGHTITLV